MSSVWRHPPSDEMRLSGLGLSGPESERPVEHRRFVCNHVRALRIAFWIIDACFVAVVVSLYVAADPYVWTVALATAALLVANERRVALEVTPEALVVRNPFSTRTIPGAQIVAFDVGTSVLTGSCHQGDFDDCLKLRLSDGTSVRVVATVGDHIRAHPGFMRTLYAFRQLHGIVPFGTYVFWERDLLEAVDRRRADEALARVPGWAPRTAPAEVTLSRLDRSQWLVLPAVLAVMGVTFIGEKNAIAAALLGAAGVMVIFQVRKRIRARQQGSTVPPSATARVHGRADAATSTLPRSALTVLVMSPVLVTLIGVSMVLGVGIERETAKGIAFIAGAGFLAALSIGHAIRQRLAARSKARD